MPAAEGEQQSCRMSQDLIENIFKITRVTKECWELTTTGKVRARLGFLKMIY
jgi:hypothetical protein